MRGLRSRRSPAVSIVFLLGLGTGLATTMFALGDPFLGKPLPYLRPDQIFAVGVVPATGSYQTRMALPALREWRARTDILDDIGSLSSGSSILRLRLGEDVVGLRIVQIDERALRILGFVFPSCAPGDPARCLVLTDATRRQFFKDVALSGTNLFATPTNDSVRIVGAFPKTFVVPKVAAQAVLIRHTADTDDTPISSMMLLTRVRAGMTGEALQALLQGTLTDRHAAQVTVEPLKAVLTRVGHRTAVVAVVAGLIVLLVCVGSASNLIFIRAYSRRYELATRAAIGASHSDMIRLIAFEVLIFGSLVIAVAISACVFSLEALGRFLPAQFSILGQPALGTRPIIFAMLVGFTATVASATLGWMVYLVRHSRLELHGRSVNHSGDTGRSIRFGAVASQQMLTMVLMTATIVLGRSYINLFGQDTGLSGPSIVVSVSYPSSATSAALALEVQAATDRLRGISGVSRVGAMEGGILDRGRGGGCCVIVGGRGVTADIKSVTPGFFDAIGALLREGRPLSDREVSGAEFVVTESFARHAWGGGPYLGQSIQLGGGARSPGRVVGVVKDAFDASLDRKPTPTVYYLLAKPIPCSGCENQFTYILRPAGEGLIDMAAVGRAARSEISGGIVTDLSTIADRLTRSVEDRIFGLILVSLFTIVGLAVCVSGLAGAVAFVTARRTRELAIRSALGAQARQLMLAVSAETLAASLVGIGLGELVVRSVLSSMNHIAYGVNLSAWTTSFPSLAFMLVVVSTTVLLASRGAGAQYLSQALKNE
jgi:hypothetical protein